MTLSRTLVPLTFILLLVACGGDSTSARPVITSFTASSTNITAGESVTLSWAVSGADTISLYDSAGETTPVTGSSQVVTPTVTTAYRLIATNQAGSAYLELTVTIGEAALTPPPDPAPTAPVITSFTLSPPTIGEAGQAVTLSWSVNGATSLSIDQGVGSVSGTSTVVYPTATTRYTLTASNASGTDTDTVLVTLAANEPPPPDDPEPPADPDPPEEEPEPEPPSGPEEPEDPDDYGLEYWVRSDCGEVFVTYSNVDGGTEQGYYGNGWVYRAWGDLDGIFLYVSAQNQCDYGDVTVRIKKFGETWRESNSSGAYVIATASGTY